MIVYMLNVHDRWWNTTHQLSTEEESTRNEADENYQLLRDLIQIVLGEYLMPQGEYTHQFGFIVLDTESL
jgi:hypothetical protein